MEAAPYQQGDAEAGEEQAGDAADADADAAVEGILATATDKEVARSLHLSAHRGDARLLGAPQAAAQQPPRVGPLGERPPPGLRAAGRRRRQAGPR
jgi:hypothetical protein